MKNFSPPSLYGIGALLLSLFLAMAAQGAEETRDFKTLVTEWVPGKKYPDIDSRDWPWLTPTQRAELAVAAARDFSWRTTNGVFITQELYDASMHRDATQTETNRAIQAQCFLNGSRLETIHMLIQDAKVSDARLIPHLIEMLEFPNAYRTVTDGLLLLTGRRIEFIKPDPKSQREERDQIVAWWREWWRKNHDRHPILDEALKRQLNQRLDQVVHQLCQDLAAHTVLDLLKRDSGRLTRIEDSEMVPTGSTPPPLLIEVGVVFGTAVPEAARWSSDFHLPVVDLDEMRMRAFEKQFGPPEECLREEVPGTDIILTVRAASPDKDFMRRLRESLARTPKADWSE